MCLFLFYEYKCLTCINVCVQHVLTGICRGQIPGSFEMIVTDGCELPRGYWESKVGPLKSSQYS